MTGSGTPCPWNVTISTAAYLSQQILTNAPLHNCLQTAHKSILGFYWILPLKGNYNDQESPLWESGHNLRASNRLPRGFHKHSNVRCKQCDRIVTELGTISLGAILPRGLCLWNQDRSIPSGCKTILKERLHGNWVLLPEWSIIFGHPTSAPFWEPTSFLCVSQC